MPVELKKTKIRRALKRKKLGARSKALRNNQGTTASFPLEGPLPSLRFGRPVEADSIAVPEHLLKK